MLILANMIFLWFDGIHKGRETGMRGTSVRLCDP